MRRYQRAEAQEMNVRMRGSAVCAAVTLLAGITALARRSGNVHLSGLTLEVYA
jgi:hypothetical protein